MKQFEYKNIFAKDLMKFMHVSGGYFGDGITDMSVDENQVMTVEFFDGYKKSFSVYGDNERGMLIDFCKNVLMDYDY